MSDGLIALCGIMADCLLLGTVGGVIGGVFFFAAALAFTYMLMDFYMDAMELYFAAIIDGNEQAADCLNATAFFSLASYASAPLMELAIGRIIDSKLGQTVSGWIKDGKNAIARWSKYKSLTSKGYSSERVLKVLNNPNMAKYSDDFIEAILKSDKADDILAWLSNCTDDVARVFNNITNKDLLVSLLGEYGDDFIDMSIKQYNYGGLVSVERFIKVLSNNCEVWDRIIATADNMTATKIPATFQVQLKEFYINPNTETNVVWTNANATEHMGEYVGRFGETSFSIDLRSQLMLESYVSALDQAMGELASKPLGRYEDLNFGGWVFGIDTKEGVVFHAFYEG